MDADKLVDILAATFGWNGLEKIQTAIAIRSAVKEVEAALLAARSEMVWAHSCLRLVAQESGPGWVRVNGRTFGLQVYYERLALVDRTLDPSIPK